MSAVYHEYRVWYHEYGDKPSKRVVKFWDFPARDIAGAKRSFKQMFKSSIIEKVKRVR